VLNISARAVLVALSMAIAGPVCAQDDGRAAREREALRRSQAALRQAQEQQATLAREKAELTAQKDQLSESARRAQSQSAAQLSAARGEAERFRAGVSRAERDAALARAEADADKKAAAAKLDEQAQRLAQASRRLEEITRSNAALTALLESAMRSLTLAEKANREMHALGLQMIERLRGKPGASSLGDPVLGFGNVRLENDAEALRDKLEAAKFRPEPR
jgi:DNA repair exonuclease SbcCD ATPase subunit